jgi:hypothetical protein
VHDAAHLVGLGVGIASTVLTAVAGSGLLGKTVGAKSGALVGLLNLMPAVLAGVGAVISAKAVAVVATPLVTPVASPHDLLGNILKPVDAVGKLIGNIL